MQGFYFYHICLDDDKCDKVHVQMEEGYLTSLPITFGIASKMEIQLSWKQNLVTKMVCFSSVCAKLSFLPSTFFLFLLNSSNPKNLISVFNSLDLYLLLHRTIFPLFKITRHTDVLPSFSPTSCEIPQPPLETFLTSPKNLPPKLINPYRNHNASFLPSLDRQIISMNRPH